MKEENTKVISGIGWSYAERILAQLVSFCVYIVLARLLEPDDFGVVSIAMIFITICDALTIGGFGNALVQKKDATNTDFNTICWISLALGGILYLILYFTSDNIEKFYNMSGLSLVTKILGVRVVISAFNSVQQAYVQKKMEFKKFFWATLGGTLVSGIVGVWMALNGFGVWALVGQYLTNSFIDSIILFIVIDWKLKFSFSIQSFKELWGYGIRVLLSTITYTIKDSIRSLVIGKKYNADDLAYYNQGQKYPSILMNDIVDSIGKVLFPFLAQKQENHLEVKKYMRMSVKAGAFVLCPVLIGLISVSDAFVYVFLTEKWKEAIIYIRVLSMVYFFRPLNTVFQKGLLANGDSTVNLIHELITSVLTIVFIIVSVFVFDSVPMIAMSYVLVTVVGTVFFAYFTRKRFDYLFKEMLADYLPYAFASGCMGLIVFWVGRLFDNYSVSVFILQVSIGIISYLLISWLLRFELFYYAINYLRRKFHR